MVPELKAAWWLNLYQRQDTFKKKTLQYDLCNRNYNALDTPLIGPDQIICLIKGLIVQTE